MPGGRRPVRLLLGWAHLCHSRWASETHLPGPGALLGAGAGALGGSAGLFGPCGSPSCH